MNYWPTLLKNFIIAFLPMLAQVVICSMVGYGLARFDIPGKALWIGIPAF